MSTNLSYSQLYSKPYHTAINSLEVMTNECNELTNVHYKSTGIYMFAGIQCNELTNVHYKSTGIYMFAGIQCNELENVHYKSTRKVSSVMSWQMYTINLLGRYPV